METETLILLVEDDPVVRTSLCRLLTLQPHRIVTTAETVTEALASEYALKSQTLELQRCFVVITDWQLPDGSGAEVLDAIDPATTPACVFTGADLASVRAAVRAHGAPVFEKTDVRGLLAWLTHVEATFDADFHINKKEDLT